MNCEKTITAGIDVGSRTTKAVIWDGSEILGRSLVATGWSPDRSAETAFQQALKNTGLRDVSRIVATGYGRVTVPFADRTITEITTHARGIARLLPDTRTLIDIGGQDSKAIIIENSGLAVDFAMNDRCAAGSDKFLEFLAMTMELSQVLGLDITVPKLPEFTGALGAAIIASDGFGYINGGN